MKKLSLLLVVFFLISFQSKAQDYLPDGPTGGVNFDPADYGGATFGDLFQWIGFIGQDGNDEYRLKINYETDFLYNGENQYYDELRIYTVSHSYEKELIKTIRKSEMGYIITSKTVRYIEIEFERLMPYPNGFNGYIGFGVEYEPTTEEPTTNEPDPDTQTFDVVNANKISLNTTYANKDFNMVGSGIINGKILITKNASDLNTYVPQIPFPFDFNVFGTSYLTESTSQKSFVTNSLTIGTSSTVLDVPLYVYTATGTGNSKITAILGNASDHWTHFGGRYGGRIKGGIYGSLTLEGNSNSSPAGDRNIYLNPTLNSDIIMAQGGGKVGIGAAPLNAMLEIYKADHPNFNIRNDYGRMELAVASCNGCWATGAKPGDGVIRTLGDSHNTILFMGNNNNDGNHYIGIGDGANGIWAKFFNNKTFRMDGILYAREVRIRTDVWSDFVFHKNYRLPSLNEVNLFIQENGHLPEIPSEAEVMENGISLSEMQAKLLQKIEELTLYAIQQQEMIGNQQLKMEKQQQDMETLKKELELLKNK